MTKLIIMDYSTTEVHIYDVEDKVLPDIQKMGYDRKNVAWMLGDNMEIVHHSEVITKEYDCRKSDKGTPKI